MQGIAVHIIKDKIERKGIKVLKIALFGSRVRGDYKEDSDWDFLVVIDKKLSFQEKWDIIDEIKIELARLKIPNDIFLRSEEEIMEAKDDVGTIVYYALKEGIEI